MIGNSIDLNLECNSIFLVIFQWQIERCFNNIDKTDVFDALRREDSWRQTLKTMAPYGRQCLMSVFVLTFGHGKIMEISVVKSVFLTQLNEHLLRIMILE